MPSPLGHALAAVATGCAVRGRPESSRRGSMLVRQAVLFAGLGVLPDVDLLVGVHRGPTHSLGAAAVVAIVALAVSRRIRPAAAAAAAYATHALLDWLGSDTSAPFGVMALWPVTSAYYQSSLHVFDAISRRYWLPGFFEQNVRAVVRELLILLPVTAAVLVMRLKGSVRSSA